MTFHETGEKDVEELKAKLRSLNVDEEDGQKILNLFAFWVAAAVALNHSDAAHEYALRLLPKNTEAEVMKLETEYMQLYSFKDVAMEDLLGPLFSSLHS